MRRIVYGSLPALPGIMAKNLTIPLRSRAVNKPKALVVFNNEDIRESLSALLKKRGMQPVQAGNATPAMERFLEEDFRLVATDIDVPGTNGLGLIRWISAKRPFLPVIIVSGIISSDGESTAASSDTNAGQKTFEIADVEAAISSVLRQFGE
jgi:DNA-binding NtrC family response regulator